MLNGFGVPAKQIIVYDCCTGSTAKKGLQMQPYVADWSQGVAGSALIPGVTSNGNASLGGYTQTPVTGLAAGTTNNCATDIANGTVDILVNIAVNKSHNAYAGGMTLCLKNHFGTFQPDHTPNDNAVPGNYIAMNKSAAILGGTPVRQQLCIVDALWGDSSAAGDPNNTPNTRVDRLIMGTFAGAVDYLTVTKVQLAIVKSPCPLSAVYNQFLTAFNYTLTDPTLTWVEFAPVATLPEHASGGVNPSTLEVRLAGGRGATQIALPRSSGPVEITCSTCRAGASGL